MSSQQGLAGAHYTNGGQDHARTIIDGEAGKPFLNPGDTEAVAIHFGARPWERPLDACPPHSQVTRVYGYRIAATPVEEPPPDDQGPFIEEPVTDFPEEGAR